jgi:hypothetical protein
MHSFTLEEIHRDPAVRDRALEWWTAMGVLLAFASATSALGGGFVPPRADDILSFANNPRFG